MFPYLFEYGPIKIGSFGIVAAIAVWISRWLLKNRLKKVGLSSELSTSLVLLTVLFGFAGAKLYFAVEKGLMFSTGFPATLLSGSGFTWYGGFFAATAALMVFSKIKKIQFYKITDAITPVLMPAYAIGRLGCLLAGDGDYGAPTTLPWGMSFPNGVVPTHVPVHPTPLYEVIMISVLIYLFMRIEKKIVLRETMATSIALLFLGTERFVAEFWRNTPHFAGTFLTMPQLFSLIVVAAAFYIFIKSVSPTTKIKR